MKDWYFSVELPLRSQEYVSIYNVVFEGGVMPAFPMDDKGNYINEFDSCIVNGVGQVIKKTKVGFVYKCLADDNEEQYFIILNTQGHISPLMDREEIIQHFKFVEAENEAIKI